MMWDSWGDFFAMGGYALYVWGSMVVVAVFLGAEVAGLRLRARAVRAQLAAARQMDNGGRR